MIKKVSAKINVPLIACGGAGSIADLKEGVSAGASAVAAGSMFVFQKKGMGVLISFPAESIVYG
jgi:cyclase